MSSVCLKDALARRGLILVVPCCTSHAGHFLISFRENFYEEQFYLDDSNKFSDCMSLLRKKNKQK